MAVHPELVLGYTPIVIILATQILGEIDRGILSKDSIRKRVGAILEDKDDQNGLVISQHLMEYIEKERKPPLVNVMDEQFIQEVKTISHEIVEKEFPEEEEYFDFLFDLTIQELEELEPGKEAEFLREMR